MREPLPQRRWRLHLKAQIDGSESKAKLAINDALKEIEKERDGLRNDLKEVNLKSELAENSLKEKYEIQIKDRDDAIERLKDMKARLSTKMVGETSNFIVRMSLTEYGQRLSPMLTLRRIMMRAVEAKETISSGIKMRRGRKSFRSCSR